MIYNKFSNYIIYSMNVIGVYNPYGLVQKAGKSKQKTKHLEKKKIKSYNIMSSTRSSTLKTRRRTIYRKRVKSSHCRGKSRKACKKKGSRCKHARGSKRRFCRKRKNQHTFKR